MSTYNITDDTKVTFFIGSHRETKTVAEWEIEYDERHNDDYVRDELAETVGSWVNNIKSGFIVED